MEHLGGRRPLIALALTALGVAVFWAVLYGGGLAIGAFALLEMAALLALAVGVAWASARKR